MRSLALALCVALVALPDHALADGSPRATQDVASDAATPVAASPAAETPAPTPTAYATADDVTPRGTGAPIFQAAFTESGGGDEAYGTDDEREYREWVVAYLLISLVTFGALNSGGSPAQH